jgi:hypothetical protein
VSFTAGTTLLRGRYALVGEKIAKSDSSESWVASPRRRRALLSSQGLALLRR